MKSKKAQRKSFEIKTKIKNFKKLKRKIPATKVIGSPITGVQARSKAKAPYLSK
jgi:hypothetical protein